MKLRPVFRFLPLLMLLLCLPYKSGAQTTTSGGLTGVVTDPSRAVVPGASIEIADTARCTTQSTKSDREGVYQFFFLAPGKYRLTVTLEGFQKASRAVNVLLGPPVTVNVALEIAKRKYNREGNRRGPDFNAPSWQGQLVETHTFGSSAASQFLAAGSYFSRIYEVKDPSQALSAFPTVLGFWGPG